MTFKTDSNASISRKRLSLVRAAGWLPYAGIAATQLDLRLSALCFLSAIAAAALAGHRVIRLGPVVWLSCSALTVLSMAFFRTHSNRDLAIALSTVAIVVHYSQFRDLDARHAMRSLLWAVSLHAAAGGALALVGVSGSSNLTYQVDGFFDWLGPRQSIVLTNSFSYTALAGIIGALFSGLAAIEARPRARWPLIAVSTLSVLTIALSGYRTAIAILLVFGVMYRRPQTRRFGLPLASAFFTLPLWWGLIAPILLFALLPFSEFLEIFARDARLSGFETQFRTLQGRTIIWDSFWIELRQRDFGAAMTGARVDVTENQSLRDQFVNFDDLSRLSAHNSIMNQATRFGALGLMSLLSIVVMAARKLRTESYDEASYVFFAALAYGGTESVVSWTSVQGSLVFAGMCGLWLCVSSSSRIRSRLPARSVH